MISLLLWSRRTRSKAINGKKKVRAALLWAAVLAMLLWAGNAQTVPALQFTEHPTPTPNSRPNAITPGPDGNFWFTEQAANKIGKITPAGAVTEFSVPTPNSNPNVIASGPDGALWFTEGVGKIGRITTAGAVTEFTLPTPNALPVGITTGPDGNLWFTEFIANKIGRITPAGSVTEFPLSAGNPSTIAAGPDGNLWFTYFAGGKIGRITPAGVLTDIPLGRAGNPVVITRGPDGAMWFTDLINRIWRVDVSNNALTSFATDAQPFGITSAPDGNLYFTSQAGAFVARLTTSGVITKFPVRAGSGPSGIATLPASTAQAITNGAGADRETVKRTPLDLSPNTHCPPGFIIVVTLTDASSLAIGHVCVSLTPPPSEDAKVSSSDLYVSRLSLTRFRYDPRSSSRFVEHLGEGLSTDSFGDVSPYLFSGSDTLEPGFLDEFSRQLAGEEDKDLAPEATDPVITSLGEFVHDTSELQLGGPFPLVFIRSYGSRVGTAAESRGFYPAAASPMGANWVHNFLILIRKIDATNVVIHYYNAQSIAFRKSGSTWQMNQPGLAFKGTPYQLVETGGKLKLADPAIPRICTFDLSGVADGAVRGVESISDRTGNTHTLSYNPDGSLKSVEDGLGRRLEFTYAPSGGAPRVSQVADQTGRSIRFAYSGADLGSATDARGKVTSYTYSPNSLLASIKRPNGNIVLQNTYSGASPKVAAQADGLGATTRFTYNADNTVITNPLGNTATHHFDGSLRMVRYTDEAGKSLRFSRDNLQRKSATISRAGDTSTITYDAASGKVTSRTDFAGKAWKYAYNSQLQAGLTFFVLSRIEYPDGTRDEFSHDERGNVTSRKDRAGKVWTYTYTARGQLLSVTNPSGGRTSLAYNEDGTLASARDPAGNLTTFGYDALKRLNRVTRADGTSVQFSYDGNDNPVGRTNEKGKTTAFAYDDNDNLSSVTDPLGKAWTFTYDANDQLSGATDPLGKKTSFAYDTLQRLKSATDPNGAATGYAYDARSRLVSVTDRAGKIWAFGYDDDGIPASLTDPLGHTWRFSSDKVGRITTIADPLSNQLRIEYNALGRVTAVTDPLSETTSFTYDERSLMSRASLPRAETAAYTRDGLGRITQITDPRGKVRSRSFDDFGRLVSVTDPRANVTRLSYDSRNRRAKIEFPSGTLSLAYDEVGLITGLNYSDGTRLEYRYDDNNRLISASGVSLEYDANGSVVASNGMTATRNAVGKVETLTLAPGKTISYAYDSRNLVTSVTDWTGGVTRFSYDHAGRLVSLSRPNGVTTAYGYDDANRLLRIAETKANAGVSAITLVRDRKGQMRQANREVPLPPAVDPPDQNYTYNDADQINAFAYDALGRLTNDGTRAYTWDLASRLTSYREGENRADFSYDALGHRLTRRSDGALREFVWNYALTLPSVSIMKEGGNPVRYYVHTPGGTLLYSIEESGSARRFYHYDENGSTIFLTDDGGNVTDRYAYSALGLLIASSGNSDNPFTFAGRFGVMRESAGLYYVRARYYDSATGRFLSRDARARLSAPHSWNPYQPSTGDPWRLFFGSLLGIVALVSAAKKKRGGAVLSVLLLAASMSCGDDKKTIIQGGQAELGNNDDFPASSIASNMPPSDFDQGGATGNASLPLLAVFTPVQGPALILPSPRVTDLRPPVNFFDVDGTPSSGLRTMSVYLEEGEIEQSFLSGQGAAAEPYVPFGLPEELSDFLRLLKRSQERSPDAMPDDRRGQTGNSVEQVM